MKVSRNCVTILFSIESRSSNIQRGDRYPKLQRGRSWLPEVRLVGYTDESCNRSARERITPRTADFVFPLFAKESIYSWSCAITIVRRDGAMFLRLRFEIPLPIRSRQQPVLRTFCAGLRSVVEVVGKRNFHRSTPGLGLH